MISQISALIFASFIVLIPLVGLIRNVAIFESFIEGGKHGFELVIKIIPFIVGMFVAIGMLQTSGFFTIVTNALAPLFKLIHFPPEILPMALLRPISGSASIAVLSDTIQRHGADSIVARTAATILGSTETTLYVIAIYFGAVNVKKYRHSIATGLIADLAGIIASVVICQLLFA